MLIIGLTGGIGSGKSAATDLFIQLGVKVVDADIVAREVVEPGSQALQSITEHFGKEILLTSGGLDRAKLRDIIFNTPTEKQWLEALLHPIIRNEIIRQLSEAKSEYAILSSPLLLETDQYEIVDRILLIDVPEEIQIKRACQRDSNSEDQIRAIMKAQASREFKRNKSDDIIDNSGDLGRLKEQVDLFHSNYLQQATN